MKQRQQQYKIELDQQAQQQTQLRQGTKRQNMMTEQQMLDYLKKKDEDKTFEEEQKKNRLKSNVQDNINQSLLEKRRAEQEQRDKLRIDNEAAREAILKQ